MSKPHHIAIIPARGGSRGVPGKNLARVGGVPLVARAIRSARESGEIHAVYVSTDDPEIARIANEWGAHVIERPADLAGDTASSESALLHAIDVLRYRGIEPSVLAFLQATSPFIDAKALGSAVRRVAGGAEDVVFAAFETYAFVWERTESGAVGVNHDHRSRARRQDRAPQFCETGGFYVMNVHGFLDSRFRFFGRIGVEEVDPATAIEIDTPAELEHARTLAAGAVTPEPLPVRALVTDFDGVHTDDTAYVNQDGSESVAVSRADGLGVASLVAAGVPVLILSREKNPVVSARARKLGVPVLQGVDDKASALVAWAREAGVELADVAFVGNDVNDVQCLEIVGWPIAVADGRPEVMSRARVILRHSGGRGAVREVADRILAASPLFGSEQP